MKLLSTDCTWTVSFLIETRNEIKWKISRIFFSVEFIFSSLLSVILSMWSYRFVLNQSLSSRFKRFDQEFLFFVRDSLFSHSWGLKSCYHSNEGGSRKKNNSEVVPYSSIYLQSSSESKESKRASKDRNSEEKWFLTFWKDTAHKRI